MRTNLCPCCGQGINAPSVSVSLRENWLRYGNNVLHLTSRLAELAFILSEKMPETVPTESIIGQMWGAKEPDFAKSNVCVGLLQLRRKLEPLGLRIVNTWGIGYRMEVIPPTSRTERSTQEESRAQA